jgi:hypothetical protein
MLAAQASSRRRSWLLFFHIVFRRFMGERSCTRIDAWRLGVTDSERNR